MRADVRTSQIIEPRRTRGADLRRVVALAAALTAGLGVADVQAAARKRAVCSGKPVERAICADATLSGLASEVSRLNAAAGADKGRRKEIAAENRAWLAERDACGAEAKDCLIEQHMARIVALRSAGAHDPKGVSSGPLAYRCDGLAERVQAAYAKTATPIAYLTWGEWAYALKGAQGAYLAELEEGPMRWSPEGERATLSIPGRGTMACGTGR
jgi:uncharacterized protein